MHRCARVALAAVTVAASPGAARAEPSVTSPVIEVHPLGPRGKCLVIHGETSTRRSATFPKIFYMNRCVGGCEVRKPDSWTTSSIDDTSGICSPEQGDICTLSEFDQGDEMWDALVACVKEVMRPFDVEIVTEDPGNVPHQEVMIAGTPDELGIAQSDTLGISNFGCDGLESALSFAFGNHEVLEGDLTYLCHVAVHEPGHAFGLSHVYACEDPMTYLTGCGTKYFRDQQLRCAGEVDGEWVELDHCPCDLEAQNSHQHLLDLFGPGPGAALPEVWIANPHEGDAFRTGDVVHAFASDPRGISRVELYLNTWKWVEVGGHDYRDRYNPYILHTPAELPDGIVDIEVLAYNDLDLMTSSGFVSVHKGSPCTSAATCLDGQICNEGRCFWPLPTVEVGDTCERVQDCLEGGCQEHGGDKRCALFCDPSPEAEQPCAVGFDCVAGESASFCWPQGGGCCSAAGRNRGPDWLEIGLFLGVIVLVSRRRTRA